MRRDRTLVKGGLLQGRKSDELFDLPEGSEASQGFSITVGQERHRGSQMIFANPLAEQPLGLAPQWKRAALAPFTLKFHLLGLRSQHILNSKGQQFRNARARVVEQQD